ncbi:GNAT family N-acetyltransferase [Microcoleus sp. FACHB-1515]|uniref:GNAT family N-acetyltransferase n=1 Tax=Cyanophyceae TaxID=3028117 RepID=UPI001689B85A|nr:GNAT family N-acetyltransferase [Microcoleus sp. FACHB-1515]MBD2092877.1 GNAT family N-acetyltransferase [Microcoleus sp. FACHB-1515]
MEKPQVEVTTWYLEMKSPAQLRAALVDRPDLTIIRSQIPLPAFSRWLYATVGEQWHWRDRLGWSEDKWMAYLDRPALQTWVAYVAGTPAGYIELEAQAEGSVEIAYFGLLPPFIGQRIGGHLLTVGIQKAWQMGAQRVWVHTCSLDGEFALKNYQARGFELYDTQIHREAIDSTTVAKRAGDRSASPYSQNSVRPG